MAYFILCTRETVNVWAIQFGDFERDVVEQEAVDSYDHLPPRDRRVIRVKTAHQRDVDAAVAALNETRRDPRNGDGMD